MATNDAMGMEIFPYLTPSEEAILTTLDPNYRTREDVQSALERKNSFAAYMKQAAMDSPTGQVDAYQLQQDTPYATMPLGTGADMQGGFAWGLALPIISQIAAPFVSRAVNGLDKLINGRGLQCKMTGGAAMANHYATNLQELQDMEADLEESNGRDFWLMLHGTVKSQIADIIPKIADISDELIDPIASMSVSHVFPQDFYELITSYKDKVGSGLTSNDSGFSLGGMIAPLAHYALRELLDKGADKAYAKMVARGAFNDANIYRAAGISPPQMRGGSKKGWRRFVNGLKSVGKTVWNVVKGIVGTVIPGIAQNVTPDQVNGAVDFVSNKLNLNPGTANILKNVANTAVSIPNQLQQGSSAKDIASNFIGPAAQLGEQAARYATDKMKDGTAKDVANRVIDIGMSQLQGPGNVETARGKGRPKGSKNKKRGGKLSFRVIPV